MERDGLIWNQEFTMPSKKPLPGTSTAGKRSTQPQAPKTTPPAALNTRWQADNRWQRTKRYGWDSR